MGVESTLELGSVLGVYRLDAVIGSGGMGAVYRATHVRLHRKAAIKVLAEPLSADPAYLSRFFHEARVVNEIGHPNIIDIIDFIDEPAPSRRVAYVMELIEGPSLAKLLAAQRLTVRQALNIELQLLDALAAVHRAKVIHRDLKPDNLLVTGALDGDFSARPSIKVLDFGIAKIQEHSAIHRTNTGILMGTPAYMSPEQAAGNMISVKADIYAAGEILFEMLAGERLFRGSNMQILRAKVGDAPVPVVLPKTIAGGARLESLIAACVAREEDARPSLEELTAEVRAILAGLDAGAPALPARATLNAPPALFQPTLAPSASTISLISPRAKMGVLPWIGGGLLLIAASIAGSIYYQHSRPAVVLEVQTLEDRTPAPEPAPIVVPEPVKEQPTPEPIKKRKVSAKSDPGPLKKGEFPAW